MMQELDWRIEKRSTLNGARERIERRLRGQKLKLRGIWKRLREREITEAREKGLEEVVIVSDTDVEERERQERKTGEQILSASRRRRRILTEELEEEVPFRPIDELQTQAQSEKEEGMLMVELEKIQREKKMKGKDVVLPPKKKFRPAAGRVAIQESQTEGEATQQHDESDEEEEIRREQRSKQKQEAVAPTYPKVQVQINSYALGQILKFNNEKWGEECAKRVNATKLSINRP